MNTTSRYLIFILSGLFLFSGCTSSREAVALNPGQQTEESVSQIRQVESSALLVDGLRQKHLGNWNRAMRLFLEAVEKDPMNDAAYFEIAKIHAMQGDFLEGLKYSTRASMLDPFNEYYQLLLADIYVLTDGLPQAIKIYENLAYNNPDNLEYLFHLANVYIHDDQYYSAIDVFERIENMIGFVEEIAVQKQRMLMQLGEYQQAITEAEKLVKAFPAEPMFYELLGELYTETGQAEKAIGVYKDLLEVDPGNPIAYLLIADYYQNQGDTLKAFNNLVEAYRSPALGVEAKGQILYTFFLLGEDDENYMQQALVLCEIMVEVHPEEAEAYMIYGDFLNSLDMHYEAREAFLKGANLDPSNVAVWQQILILDSTLGDFEAMKDHSEQALEYFFEHAFFFLFNGIAHISMKNYPDAANSLEYGLLLVVNDKFMEEHFLTMLGDVHHYLENYETSDSYYEKAIALNPENATALNNFSYHLAQRGIRLQEAKQMSEKSMELENDNPAFFDTYGWILYQLGNFEEARYWIQKAVNSDEQASGVVLEHYGDVNYQLGNKQKALEYWQKAKDAGEGSSLLDKKINTGTLHE
jgi:tetratricopeptide (TPR) repeat protein